MTPFTKRMIELRKRTGISQMKLSRLINVDHSYISRIEAGNREPTHEVVLRICRELGDTNETLMIAAGWLPSWLMDAVNAGQLSTVTLGLGDLRAITEQNPKQLMWRIHLLTETLAQMAGGRHGQTTIRPTPAAVTTSGGTAYPVSDGGPGGRRERSVGATAGNGAAVTGPQPPDATGAARGAA